MYRRHISRVALELAQQQHTYSAILQAANVDTQIWNTHRV